MVIKQDSDYDKPSSQIEPATLADVSRHGAGAHGADAHFGHFGSRDFWEKAPPLTGVTFVHGTHGLGFNEANWDFTKVGIDGHPRLRGPKPDGTAGGPVMGGQ
jgi:hypothetical protein